MSDSQPSPPEGSPNARHRVWGPQFLRRTRSILENAGAGAQELGRRLEQGRALREQAGGGFCLMDQREHWDLAVVLDACRYDVFARVNRLPGRLEKRISPGSSTEEWVEVNCDGDFQDVVYVSASPYVSRLYLEQLGLSVPFAHLEETWKKGWDENLHTVPPQAVMEAYRRVKTAWPMKRFVLHFMQPHYPFIGATRIGAEGWRKYWGAIETEPAELQGATVYELLEDGRLDPDQVRKAYEDNLRLVLGHVEALLAERPGRVVVTSDHGECFGECGVFGHPPGVPLPELIEVPYLLVA